MRGANGKGAVAETIKRRLTRRSCASSRSGSIALYMFLFVNVRVGCLYML